MEILEKAYRLLFMGSVIFLAVAIAFCLLRAILGPRTTDRLVAINLIGCKTILLFAVLAVLLDEMYLLDVTIIYALISFLAVVVLSRVFLSAKAGKRPAPETAPEAEDAREVPI